MPKCILVVDDEERIRSLLKAYLTQEGFRVVTAANGREALSVAGRERPDLIILDIMMPRLDGYMVGKLTKDHPRTRGIPILVISALREVSRLFTATVQVDGFLNKPFAPEELLAFVAKILAHPHVL